ncbi:unnamed protein product [Closterium sp. Naga37s-1]|nr:unnamed protein product [Closterium sp. Naga37s-1]
MDKASYDFSTGGVTIAFSTIILQYVLKLILAARFTVRAQRVNGYIFGAAWWGFALNFIAYMIAAHVFGSLWYLLASERVATCFQTLCQQVPTSVCNPNFVTCPDASETTDADVSPAWAAWGNNSTLETTCFEGDGTFNFGIYHMALQLMKDGSAIAKIFYGLFFGIMTLSSFGNALVPSTNFVETTFAVIMVLSGLMLFTLLIGNIQVFLHSITSRMEEMQLRRQDLTWWMNRHQLPPALQRRVLRQEQQNFTATRGIDEEGLIRSMPKSLRRDIKRHLCLDLVKQVPLFQVVDSAALDAICERLKPLILIHGTEIVRQGEPVCMMLFLIRGTIRSTHTMSHGSSSSCLIRDGYFCGEELLSWGLGHSPDTNQLPSATATLTTVTAVEGFVLEAEDLLFVTTHFKFNWKSQRIQRWVRYYSPHWRTWAALTIQISWRRHVAQQHATSLQRSLDAHADVDVRGGQLTTDTPSGAPPASAATAPAPVPVPATATATSIDTPTTTPISSTAP